MAHFVLYYHPKFYDHLELSRTIKGLIDSVKAEEISSIIICQDGQLHSEDDIPEGNLCKVVEGDSVGRAKLFNLALEKLGDDDIVVFLNGPMKFKPGWYERIVPHIKDNNLLSSEINSLDRSHWSFDKIRWNKFGFRWDLNLIAKTVPTSDFVIESPVLSSYCMIGKVGWINNIGGFDDNMIFGNGEDIELSIRCWLMGGSCDVVVDSMIAVVPRMDVDGDTFNKCRIAELWLGKKKSNFYESAGLTQGQMNTGRTNGFNHIRDKFEKSFSWFIEYHQPEISQLYDIAKWSGKSVGIVSNGYSIDLIDQSMVNNHDILIGVDFMGNIFECDYIVTNDVSVIEEMSHLYKQKEFFIPIKVTDVNNGRYIDYKDILPQATVFESSNNLLNESSSTTPPFIDFNDNTMYAVQVAMFMKPREIVIYGLDNKIIDGKSHSSNIECYNGGKVLPDNNITRKHYANLEYGLSRLGNIALKNGISLLRMSHL